jgi:hypothetical protein
MGAFYRIYYICNVCEFLFSFFNVLRKICILLKFRYQRIYFTIIIFVLFQRLFFIDFLFLKMTFNFTYFQSKFWSPLWSPLLSCFRPKSPFLHFIKYCKSILYTYVSRLHNPEIESSNLSLATFESPV